MKSHQDDDTGRHANMTEEISGGFPTFDKELQSTNECWRGGIVFPREDKWLFTIYIQVALYGLRSLYLNI